MRLLITAGFQIKNFKGVLKMRKFDSNIYVDEDDLYCLKLTQVEIILL